MREETSEVEEQTQVKVRHELGDELSYAPCIRLLGTSDTTDDDERRGGDRKSYDVAVYVRTDDDEIFGLCGDISDGGLFVTTREKLVTGTLVEVEILLPDSNEDFVVEAEVRWTRDEWDEASKVVPGFGVRFLELTDEARERLETLMDAVEDAEAKGLSHAQDERGLDNTGVELDAEQR